MQRSLLFFLTVTTGLLSCKKQNERIRFFDGTWHMWYVENKSTGDAIQKPSNSKDVILLFISKTDTTGAFSGSTPSNQIFSNPYLLTGQRSDLRGGNIKIPSLSMTNTTETSWGKLFVENFRKAKKYAFESPESLFIYTTDSLLITFKKQ